MTTLTLTEPTTLPVTETRWTSPFKCQLDHGRDGSTYVTVRLKPTRVHTFNVNLRGPDGPDVTYPKGVSIHDVVEQLGGEPYPCPSFEVGDGITTNHYSDCRAWTVIDVSKSGKTITIQRDKATLLNGVGSGEPDALVLYPGGFAGHTSGTQRYSYERDPEGQTAKVRLNSRTRVWRAEPKVGAKSVSPGRHEHYDFNF